MSQRWRRVAVVLGVAAVAAPLALALLGGRPIRAGGGVFLDVGSDGSDGDLVITAPVTIDLSQAVTASWDTPSPLPGRGVYDPEKWAVVFKFRSVQIEGGNTVRFTNHPSRAPVVWLVQEDASIGGQLDVSGKDQITATMLPSEPGPGGFRGGHGHEVGTYIRSGGFGPGGGARQGEGDAGGGGSHGMAALSAGAGAIYGEVPLLALIGGSGAGGGKGATRPRIHPGGSGGGAILVAAGGEITVTSYIFADGGTTNAQNAGGSGGSIRLVASRVRGTGRLYARGGTGTSGGNIGRGGDGIIHVEALESTLLQGDPPYTFSFVGAPPQIWPPASAPRVTIARVSNADAGDLPVPADPRARFDGEPNADVVVHTDKPLIVEIAAENVPLEATVTLRVVPRLAEDFVVAAVPVAGNAAASRWQAVFLPPHGIAAMQARADLP